ncbi:MAG TPA: hypothetical protein VFS20_04155 [Longimicrobium sp.]|nr:hypothetical protein [Longimicrobium sp.]
MVRTALLALAAALVIVPAAHGQAATPDFTRASLRPLESGDTVRLLSSAGRYTGTITQLSADTLVVAAPGRVDAVVRSDVTEMYRLVSRESRKTSILRGAGFGLLGGAVLGLLGGTAIAGSKPFEDGTATAAFTADGALVGAMVGAMIGPTFRRVQWERVNAAPADPPVAPVAAESQP